MSPKVTNCGTTDIAWLKKESERKDNELAALNAKKTKLIENFIKVRSENEEIKQMISEQDQILRQMAVREVELDEEITQIKKRTEDIKIQMRELRNDVKKNDTNKKVAAVVAGIVIILILATAITIRVRFR